MSLILRKDLTRPLTHEELDGNFTYLNVKYWQKQPYEVGQFVLRDENDGTVLYYCNMTHTEYEYDTLNGGDFIAEYIDGATSLPVIIWKMVGGTGSGVGTITGATNLEGAPTQPTNADTYTAVFKDVTDNTLNFKTLNSPDGSIIITNDNGTIYLSANITPISAVNFTVESITGVTCYGGYNGGITVSAGGGSGSFRFTRDGGLNWTEYFSGTTITYTFTGLSAGSYSVGVYDEVIGAQPYTTVNLTGNTQIIITKTSETQPIVPIYPGGSLEFSISGGVAPYTYNINGTTGTTSDTFTKSSLPAGTYTVSVTDSLGCSTSNTYTLAAENLQLSSATATKTDPTCYNGTGVISVAITNGSHFYYYSLDGGVTYTSIPSSVPSGILTIGPTGGTYNVYIKDAYGGTVVSAGTVTLTNPPQIGLLSVSGNTTYCGNPPGIVVYVTGVSSTQQARISINSGVTYNNATYISGTTWFLQTTLPANTIGTANIKFFNQNCPGYTGTTTYSYSGFTAIATGSTTATAPVCSSDLWQYSFTVTGGSGSYDYRFSGATPGSWATYTGQPVSVSSLYSRIQFRDANSTGCTVNYAVNNSSPSAISASASVTSAIACSGGTGSVLFTLSGGISPYEYIILSGATTSLTSGTTGTTSGSPTISGLRAGYYNIMVRTSGSTCPYVTGNTVQLIDPAPIYLSGITVTSGSCGGNATVVLTFTSTTTPIVTTSPSFNGIGYSSPGSNIYQQTLYFVPPINTSVTFNYYNTSCPYTGTTGATVTAPSGLAVTLGTPTYTPKCPGEYWQYTPTLTSGTPPYQYQISGGTWTSYTTGTPINITATSSTTNSTTTIKFRDSLGCGSGTTYNVNNSIVNPITISSFTATQPSCPVGYYGQLNFTLSGGANFTPSNVFQYLLVSGSTSGTVTSSGATWVSLSAGVTSGVVSSLPDGYYKLLFRTQAGSGCTPYVASAISGITTPPAISGTVLGYTGVTTCGTNNGRIQITVTGGTGSYEYKLDASPTWLSIPSLPFTITGQSATTHLIYLRDTNACAASNSPLSVTLTGVSNPTLTGTYTSPICGSGNALITLNASGTPNYTYYSGATSLITTSATTYSFYVTPYSGSNTFSVNDGAGCTNTISITGSGTTSPLTATATVSGTTLTITLGGSSVPSYTYALYSGATVAGGSLITSYSSVPNTFYDFTGLTAGGQYIVRVIDNNGCSADSASVTIPSPAYLYYGFYQTGAAISGVPTAPIIYRGSGAGAALSDFTTNQTYTNKLTSTAGQTINNVVNYIVSQNTLLGGQNSPIDLTTAIPGGFSSSTPLSIPLTGVTYNSAYIFVLVPNVSPWTTDLTSGNHFYQGTTLITGSVKYTGGTSIIIGSNNYTLYRVGTSSYGAGTSFTNINIQ